MISSSHCEQRKCEREISRLDLQAAKKYGSRKIQISHNGKLRVIFTYNNIVYITESDEETSVTCYALKQLPLDIAVIDELMRHQILEQTRRIISKEKRITSHTIFIIDQSTSMNNSDIMGHRSRSRGVFYTIANEMIAKPLLKDILSYTDVVTLIEMRTESNVHSGLYMEPVTWDLHNKFVRLAGEDQALRGRGQGNYIPAIKLAFDILGENDNGNSALNIFFLSDGRPSDQGKDASTRILRTVQSHCSKFRDRLTFGVFGFARNIGSQFQLLEEMSIVARNCGCNGLFSCGLDTHQLRASLSTMSSTMVNSRNSMSTLAGGTLLRQEENKAKRVKREDLRKDAMGLGLSDVFNPSEFDFYYLSGRERLIRYVYKWNIDTQDEDFRHSVLLHPDAIGIAIKKSYIAAGGERAAFHMTEVGFNGLPLGRPMVAKMSLYEEPSQLDFHKSCARSQLEARRLSHKFNSALSARWIIVPNVVYLDPSFYEWSSSRMISSAILAENRLDCSRYRKWNDNKGGVHDLLTGGNVRRGEMVHLGIIEEEGEDGESLGGVEGAGGRCPQSNIIDDDVPQAFSHWTYQYTQGSSLVCDLQGVLSSSFQLTDPAIHSKKRKFGLTDHGPAGQDKFFRTHECNPLCRALGLRMPSFKPQGCF
jgi:hypothetical protein